MNLYQIRDDDGATWTFAEDFNAALEKWRRYYIQAAELDDDAMPNPISLTLVAEADEVLA